MFYYANSYTHRGGSNKDVIPRQFANLLYNRYASYKEETT